MSIINVELFDETVSLLKDLGHQVYIGLDQCPTYLKQHIQTRNKKNDISGLDPIPAMCHQPYKDSKSCYIYLQSEADKAYLWHEAWHALQFCHDPNRDQFWFVDGNCPTIPQEMLQEGIAVFAEAMKDINSLWSSTSQPWEVPAAAVENHPDFVVSMLKKIATPLLKQQGLFDLIFKKCSFSPLVESYKNGPKDHIYSNFFAVVMKHYIVTKDSLEWKIQVRYLGSNPEPITLLEFCRQNEFVIPKHLL